MTSCFFVFLSVFVTFKHSFSVAMPFWTFARSKGDNGVSVISGDLHQDFSVSHIPTQKIDGEAQRQKEDDARHYRSHCLRHN